MSVFVKDMEMPKCCYNCFIPCDVLPLGYHKLDEFREQRYEDCPLVEVPTLHGDLAEWLAKRIKDIITEYTIAVIDAEHR